MGNKTKNWKEFRETGLFLFVNSFLHIFGWQINLVLDNEGKVSSVYPERTTNCGFSEESMERAYLRIKKHIGIYEEEEIEEDPSKEEAKEMAEINNDKNKIANLVGDVMSQINKVNDVSEE